MRTLMDLGGTLAAAGSGKHRATANTCAAEPEVDALVPVAGLQNAALVAVYGKNDCVDTRRTLVLLTARHVAYRYIDVGADDAQRRHAETLSGGPAVPVVVLPGGALVEPTDDDLVAALVRDRLLPD